MKLQSLFGYQYIWAEKRWLPYGSCQNILSEYVNMWRISCSLFINGWKTNTDSVYVVIFNKFKMTHISCQMSLQGKKSGFMGMIWKQNRVITVEIPAVQTRPD